MKEILEALGVKAENNGACTGKWIETTGPELISYNPTTGEPIASVRQASVEEYEQVVAAAEEGFKTWRMMPAPLRGQVIRDLGEELRK